MPFDDTDKLYPMDWPSLWRLEHRRGRLSYVANLLFWSVVTGLLWWFGYIALMLFTPGGALVFTVFMILFWLAVFSALGIQRLHDFGYSSEWALLLYVPVANVILLLMFVLMKGKGGLNPYPPLT